MSKKRNKFRVQWYVQAHFPNFMAVLERIWWDRTGVKAIGALMRLSDRTLALFLAGLFRHAWCEEVTDFQAVILMAYHDAITDTFHTVPVGVPFERDYVSEIRAITPFVQGPFTIKRNWRMVR